MVVALGMTLAFGGLVTHAAVSFVGIALALIGGSAGGVRSFPRNGWSRSPCARRSYARGRSCHRARAVERSSIGEGGHRIRVPVEIQPYSAGIRGGVVGGIAMAILALAYGLIVQRSFWYPINLLSAVAMPALARAPSPSSARSTCRPS